MNAFAMFATMLPMMSGSFALANLGASIFAQFTAALEWLIGALNAVVALFWDDATGLTFFGILAIIALSISVFFLLMRVVQNFLHFRS